MTPQPPGGPRLEDPLGFVALPTPRLRRSVDSQRGVLADADFREFVSVIRSVFDKFSARLASAKPGVERGHVLHQLTEQTMEAAAGLGVTCCKGCSGCCHYEIEITADEAAVLAEVVRAGHPVNMDRLRLQAARARKSEEWQTVLNPDNRCVFLGDDGACQIYAERPSSCRRHLVTSPASACTVPGQPVAPVEILTTEILMSAALSLEGTTFASLSKMLLGSLGARG